VAQQPLRILQSQEFSPEATQLAGTYQLGEPLADYKVGLTKRMRTYAIIGIAGTIFWAVLIYLGLTSPQNNDGMSGTLTFAAFALGCLGLAVYYLTIPVIKPWHVYVCKEGFAFTNGKKSEPYRWDSIASVMLDITSYSQYGMNTGTTYKYTVRRNDGEKLVLDDKFIDVDALGNTITQEAAVHMLPRVMADFNAGQTITFGSLSVNQQGVSNGRNILPWSEVSGVFINKGFVIVLQKGKKSSWANIRVAKVPNVFVLDALVRSLAPAEK
jgi:hypothetical protein